MTSNPAEADTSFAPSEQNQRRLRDAFGRFATGVTVVTTRTADGPVGMTANSFSSVSLDPPLVLWCIDKASDRFEVFRHARHYAIHVLDAGQRAVSDGFARDGQYFDHLRWCETAEGVPALSECLARFDCHLEQVHEAGDHVILVGRVQRVDLRSGSPLIFALGGYGALAP
jgi:flavin reductase (DIM6/NTAB) family NADH-FMN oxidoreductase RutF